MVRKRNVEKEFIEKSSRVLKYVCALIGIVLFFIYGINGGFASLLFDLRESKTVVGYCVAIIILLALLVICNLSDAPSSQTKRQKDISSYVTVGIIIVIIIFGILLLFTLLDFFLPVIVLVAFLLIVYFLITKLIAFLVNKYGIK